MEMLEDKEVKTHDETCASWTSCLGLSLHLLDYVEDCKIIHKNATLDHIANAILYLTQIIDFASVICDISRTLLRESQKTLQQLTNRGEISEENSDETIIDPDPGKRVKIIFDNQRNYLIHIGPHQPELPHFPINQSISKTKQSKFPPKWYKEYPHLEYSIEKDAAFCFVCCLFSEGVGREKSDPAWTITGVNRWDKMKSVGKSKLGKLAQHFSSSSHKSALSDYSHIRSSLWGHVDVLLSKQKRSDLVQQEYDNSFNHQILSILFDVARTLGRQGLAFRGDGKEEDGNFKQIVYLLSRHCYVMKKWLDSEKFRPYHVTYLSATSQNEMIYLLGAEVKKAVAEEVKKAEMFSIMADTTPDTSHKDILSINVRIINREGLAKERLLQVLAIQDKTGAGLANEIAKSLSENLLDINNVAFQSYDVTSSMSGQ